MKATTFIFRPLLAAVILLVTGVTGLAEEADEVNLDDILPELEDHLEDLLVEVPIWDPGFTFSTGFGYRDNVLFATARPRGSTFWAAGAEFFLMRLPQEGPEFFLFLSGENYFFLSDRSLPDERLLTLLTELSAEVAPLWTTGIALQGFFSDQVMDVSTHELEVGAINLEGGGVTLTPFIRRDLAEGASVQAAAIASRQIYRAPLDDYSEVGPKVIFGFDRAPREFTLSYEWQGRWYDDRPELSLEGERLPDTRLNFRRQRVEGTFRQFWGERRWRTTTRLGFEANRDGGSGYFDYNRLRAAQQLRWQPGQWELEGQVRFSHHEYLKQLAEPDEPGLRRRNSTSFHGGIRRKLPRGLTLLADYEREQVRGDARLGDYEVNTVLVGLEWEL